MTKMTISRSPMSSTMLLAAVALVAAVVHINPAAASGAVELTKDNFSSEVAGKNAFVKFLAPW